MADDNTIIEGTVKFRDGKKWKSRWCVMRKLSPVADCVHLQLYRDSRARWGGGGGAGAGAGAAGGGGGGCKAALSLQQFIGCETGFTLDKQSNTMALLCTDLVAILAFETRERLIQWQVKVSAHLGEARHYLVLVGRGAGGGGGGGKGRLPAGPARLHLHEHRFALTAGVPPRLLGVWEIAHLRRYGVVEGRFCFEGGSHCGKGEGLHLLITDQAKEIAHDFDLASQGRLSPKRRPINHKKNDGAESPKSHKAFRPDTRLSELNTVDHSLPPMDLRLYSDECGGDGSGAISPYWPSMERQYRDLGLADTASVHEGEGVEGAGWGAGGRVSLERCMSCMSKLGALSRSSTAALTPGAKHFSPAWTMDALHEAAPSPPAAAPDLVLNKVEDACSCPAGERAPGRPPKPTRLELNLNHRKAPMPLPTQTCSCSSAYDDNKSRVGPYENYDIPKLSSIEIDSEYYDTPKRLKECLNNELFQITKSSTPSAVILKKPCGCLLKLGKRRKDITIINAEDSIQPAPCPCQRVTDWANSWIKLPYCRKNTVSTDNLVQNKENYRPDAHTALYATIDLSRKTRRKTHPIEPDEFVRLDSRAVEVDEGPLANYENLNFALSLEYYENAKDLLRRAGVTQSELNAISANLIPPELPAKCEREFCQRCGRPPAGNENHSEPPATNFGDDYLLMEPKSLDGGQLERSGTPRASSGYTPMSPFGGFALGAPRPRLPECGPSARLLGEKSASNPTLCAEEEPAEARGAAGDPAERRKRSSSADSSRFLEDVKEFEGSVGSRGSSSSIETLRNLALDADAALCRCAAGGKHSDADSSEASRGVRGAPPARRASAAPGAGNRDSSSSNDSGVSSCSLRRGAELADFELPPTTAAARRHYRSARRQAAAPHAAPPRRSRSTDPRSDAAALQRRSPPPKSSSAEAEVPVLCVKSLRGIVDTHSTSSGTSDMSDYIETLSICSSHSSTDTPITMRVVRPQTTSTLRPRSGKEYGRLPPRRAPRAPPAAAPPPAPAAHYSNLP